ncbi:MAG: phage tail protein [Endomicrobium sp.]|jgi:hypothetical protein|nr:phage tail protein [Endomicrobium sp.]
MKKTTVVINVLFLFLSLAVNVMAKSTCSCGDAGSGCGRIKENFEFAFEAYVSRQIKEQCGARKNEVRQQFVCPTVRKCIDALPVGTVITFAGNKVPNGYLPCDGGEYDVLAYPDLFEAIGTIYGNASADNFFKLPDYRGMFLRGTGGNAAPLGQPQNDAIRNIEGQFWGDSRRNQGYTAPSGAFSYADENGGTYGGRGEGGPCKYSFSAANIVPTANENRPVNRAVNFFIKYKNFCQDTD